jgi:predicted transposase/invertase (TIGR01784 family)
MVFINPKIDFAFKKIFGSEQSQPILISFLNGLLYDGQPTIQSLDILDPYQAPRIRGVKNSYLDVKAKLQGGKTVIIEMQVLNVEGFEKRILYNATKAYSIQLDVGQNYSLLEPVIALTITDFVMFAGINTVISHFVLKEKTLLIDYPAGDLELVFVELPKFDRQLDELVTLTDKWIYFLQHTVDLKTVPEVMGEVPEIRQAFERANQANLNRTELDELERQVFFIYDQQGAINKATQQGLQQGLQQGAQQTQQDIARRLLFVLEDEMICQTTGLTLEEVQELRQSS